MSTFDPQHPDESVDHAVKARLARLRSMPVDTGQLETALRRQIGPRPRAWKIFQIRPLRAAVASIAILAMVTAAIVATTSRPAVASPMQMAAMYQDIVSGKAPAMQVDSIQAANRALAVQSPQSPQVPAMPSDHIMACSCCMRNFKDKKVACVLLKDEGVPLTLTVANAADMRTPAGTAVTHDGVEYHVQSCPCSGGTLNMVMTQRNGRWVCLTGQIPSTHLMELAGKLEF